MKHQNLDYIASVFKNIGGTVTTDSLNNVVLIVPASKIVPTRRILRDHSRFQRKVLSELTAVDYIGAEKGRFQRRYSLLSIQWCTRLTVKTFVDELTPIDSVVTIYPAANWYEREVYDRYGVRFRNHPDLRRILTDYGFEGHPLRKDFPLTGFTEVRFDEAEKRVVQEVVTLPQERSNY